MKEQVKRYIQKMQEEISEIRYDLETFPVGEASKKSLMKGITEREKSIKNAKMRHNV